MSDPLDSMVASYLLTTDRTVYGLFTNIYLTWENFDNFTLW